MLARRNLRGSAIAMTLRVEGVGLFIGGVSFGNKRLNVGC